MKSFKKMMEQPKPTSDLVRQAKIAFSEFVDIMEKLAKESGDKAVEKLYKNADNKWWSDLRKVTDKHR